MTDRPILFSAPMVRAILDGRKMQTRRVVKGIEKVDEYYLDWPHNGFAFYNNDYFGGKAACPFPCPYGAPDDRLWVRETHYRFGHWEPVQTVRTRTGRQKWAFVQDSSEVLFDAPAEFRKGRHHKDPSTPAWHKRLARFQHRWASRITLEITNVRVERLQDISEADAIAEGIIKGSYGFYNGTTGCEADTKETTFCAAKNCFGNLWQSINGPDSWDANPWIWVIEFKRVQP